MGPTPDTPPLPWRVAAVISLMGAMAFVLALACGAWFYLVRLGPAMQAGPRPSAGAIAFNFGLFTIFALHHSVMARLTVKRWLVRVLPAELERASFVWGASGLFIAMCLAWQPMAGTVWRLAGGMQMVGYAMQAAGLWFTVAGARSIDVLDLAGVRWLVGGAVDADDDLITEQGPFGFVRHPIYLGWVLMTFGAPEMTVGRLSFSLISFVYLLVAIPLEERALVARHGATYRKYQSRVRWRLLPGMY